MKKFTLAPVERSRLHLILQKDYANMYNKYLKDMKLDQAVAQDRLLQSLPSFCRRALLKKLKDATLDR